VHGGFVADGEFVVAGGHGPVALEPTDAAFDRVAQLVQVRVEGRRGWRGSRRLYRPVPAAACPGPPAAGPGDLDGVQDGLELGAVGPPASRRSGSTGVLALVAAARHAMAHRPGPATGSRQCAAVPSTSAGVPASCRRRSKGLAAEAAVGAMRRSRHSASLSFNSWMSSMTTPSAFPDASCPGCPRARAPWATLLDALTGGVSGEEIFRRAGTSPTG
jgi:hypothetical protein